jgi:hypothetical protein
MGAILTLAIGIFGLSSAHAASVDTELAAIKRIESSNGTNVAHPLIKSGIHKGTRAGGYYGIMPITAKELIKHNPKTLSQYVHLLNKTNDEVTQELNANQKLDKALAMMMWNSLRKNHSANTAACAWFWGPSSSRCKGEVKSLQYVDKFITAMNN